jgi:hypothetical protein
VADSARASRCSAARRRRRRSPAARCRLSVSSSTAPMKYGNRVSKSRATSGDVRVVLAMEEEAARHEFLLLLQTELDCVRDAGAQGGPGRPVLGLLVAAEREHPVERGAQRGPVGVDGQILCAWQLDVVLCAEHRLHRRLARRRRAGDHHLGALGLSEQERVPGDVAGDRPDGQVRARANEAVVDDVQ